MNNNTATGMCYKVVNTLSYRDGNENKEPSIHLENYETQKQPSRGVLRKKFSENMQQIHWTTPMLLKSQKLLD